MSNYVTIRGFVGTEPKCSVAGSGLPITKFRLGSTNRFLDKKTNTWTDGETNWYSISLFRQLATNAGVSLQKGDPIIVSGRLRIRPWVNEEGKSGTTVEIDADSAGHDLVFGTANFRRSSADRNDAGVQPASDDSLPADFNYSTGELPSGAGYESPGAPEEGSAGGGDTEEEPGSGENQLAKTSAPF
ncbi:single-strand DNA-binding protein [Arthrobacter pigmenti]|uniref:Single-stranded DNA-binding protein n=1 Tax=Arthrobacter pigmenti TaxID=271432 RepID=A0A846RW91_9MICC|nr:single-stranded DNA-binding protein [Arthrobacter pigmenti]NJC22511.1 single-strand DNA-binding protein [Arthrobacter pigmenti]